MTWLWLVPGVAAWLLCGVIARRMFMTCSAWHWDDPERGTELLDIPLGLIALAAALDLCFLEGWRSHMFDRGTLEEWKADYARRRMLGKTP